MRSRELAHLEEALGHRFGDRDLLRLALVHRSYLSDHPEVESNERLEFLGDAVLQLAVTDHIYQRFPQLSEGDLAKVRAGVVNAVTLARLAERLGLGRLLVLGRGEETTGGRSKSSILADAIEAVFGALYLDAGYERAKAVILDLVAEEVRERAAAPGRRDYKTRLQELLAKRGRKPYYEVRGEGPDHHRTFTATIRVDGEVLGHGTGRSKKGAEQMAARQGLERLLAP